MLTEEEVFDRFLASVQSAGGQRAWARAHGLTPAYISDIVNRRRKLSARVLAAIGVVVETTTVYRELARRIEEEETQMHHSITFSDIAESAVAVLRLDDESYSGCVNRLIGNLAIFLDADNYAEHFGEQVVGRHRYAADQPSTTVEGQQR